MFSTCTGPLGTWTATYTRPILSTEPASAACIQTLHVNLVSARQIPLGIREGAQPASQYHQTMIRALAQELGDGLGLGGGLDDD